MKTPIPWRAAVLFLLVSSAVLVTFAAWGDAIDAWTRATVEKAGGARFSNVEGSTWWAFLAATAVSGIFVAVRCALTRPAQIES